MTGAWIILGVLVLAGVLIYLSDRFYYRKKHPEADPLSLFPSSEKDVEDDAADSGESAGAEPEVCCGMHTVCEKTSLSPVTGEIVYYDDEELDRFRGRGADEYNKEETEEFRDVLMTLLPQDVAGWSRSIQVRGITLPSEIRDELLLIVSDLRK